MPEIYPKGRIYKQDNGETGWRTSEKTRKIMVDGLGEMIPEHDIEIKSRWTISEALSFVLNADGKYEAHKGAHDDTVIANAGVVQLYKNKPLKQMSAIRDELRARKHRGKPNAYFTHE